MLPYSQTVKSPDAHFPSPRFHRCLRNKYRSTVLFRRNGFPSKRRLPLIRSFKCWIQSGIYCGDDNKIPLPYETAKCVRLLNKIFPNLLWIQFSIFPLNSIQNKTKVSKGLTSENYLTEKIRAGTPPTYPPTPSFPARSEMLSISGHHCTSSEHEGKGSAIFLGWLTN